MNAKKILMPLVIAASLLASCGNQPAVEKKTMNITVWCSETALKNAAGEVTASVVDTTKAQIAKFEEENGDLGIHFEAKVVGITEADSATKMLTDVDAGADIFCFAQDQYARLIAGNALLKLGKAAADEVKANNDDGAVGAVTAGENIYAYPMTSDNGYYLYYDKSVVSENHLGSVEDILADCVAAGRNFAMENETSAWYIASWFFARESATSDPLCVSEWTVAKDGKTFTGVHDTFNSDNGLIAVKGMQKLITSPNYVSASGAVEFNAAIKAGALVSGTWSHAGVVDYLGDNLGVAELPSYTVDGKSYHLGSFSGNKLMGVKPSADAERNATLQKLARYLTGEACQMDRFNTFGWGPSNKAAQATEAVKNAPHLGALVKQNAYAIPQGQIHGSWWDIGKAIGADVIKATDEDGLKAALTNYAAKLEDIFAAPSIWGLVGSMEASDWTTNIDLTEGEDGKWTLDYTLAANDEFKFRINSDWGTALGASKTTATPAENFDLTGDNIKCVVAGDYHFVVDPTAESVTITVAA